MGDNQGKLAERSIEVHKVLLDFYGNPVWHTPLPPMDELISTILSQNTNDVNRDVAFNALIRAFPSWEAVRDASESAVVQAIRPAGLANQKGPRIQEILREITRLRGSLTLDFLKDYSIPEAKEWLKQFKGVGPKTAAIVLQFSLDMPAFPVDTHVYRVSGRIGLRPENMSAEKAHEYLETLFPSEAYFAAHLNIISLGREICIARKPKCSKCPLKDMCAYYAVHYDTDGRLLDEA